MMGNERMYSQGIERGWAWRGCIDGVVLIVFLVRSRSCIDGLC